MQPRSLFAFLAAMALGLGCSPTAPPAANAPAQPAPLQPPLVQPPLVQPPPVQPAQPVAANPATPKLGGSDIKSRLNALGELYANNELDTMKRDALAFTKEFPESALGHSHLGYAYFGLGEFDKASMQFTMATELNPRLEQAYIGMIKISIKQRNFDAARNQLDQAAGLFPESWDVEFHRSVLQYADGNVKEAVSMAERAWNKSNNVEIANALAKYYHSAGDATKREAFVKEATKLGTPEDIIRKRLEKLPFGTHKDQF